ncbi:MAG TPA: TAXI family TRAP transporter solute-binding subunit [Steroidobacteraceae bacterium]|nr:TAXI family TRAP transporter solute-binding subunit [Steroidobacteraceae bacterium]
MNGKLGFNVRQAVWLYVVAGALILIAVVATIAWLGPLPPKVVTMSTGTAGSDFDQFGREYQAILKRAGVQLRLVPSAGSVENLARLNDPRSGVAVAFAQGGLTTEAKSPDLESLGTVFYQPFWLFVRRGISLARPEDLRGKRVAAGPDGSGTQVMAKKFLALNGIDESTLQIVPLPATEAGEALTRGEIDAAAMVASWDTPIVHRLLASPDINIVGAPRADAYVALDPYLTKLVLPTGVGDLASNRPPNDVTLVATQASLIVRKDLHPAVQYLLLEAATEIHSDAGLFRKAGEFPAPAPVDLPISKDARQFYKSGSPFLQRYLPYGLAVLASRLLLLLIPVIGVAYPLLRMAPALYGWSMRRRIFRLYGELKYIETELENARAIPAADLLTQLQRLEERANRLQLPFAFAPFLYQLRNHIALVRARIQAVASGAAAPAAQRPSAAAGTSPASPAPAQVR